MVTLALATHCHHMVVGQELEVEPHLAAHQPHKRVPPAQYRAKLHEQDVNRMPLAHVRLLVNHNLAQLRFVLCIGIHENPLEERERACIIVHPAHLAVHQLHPLRSPHPAEDGQQLHQHAGQQHRHTNHIDGRAQTHPGKPSHVARHHHRGKHHLLVGLHKVHGRSVLLNPPTDVHQRHHEGSCQHRHQRHAAEFEKRVAHKQQPVKAVEQHQQQIGLQQQHSPISLLFR